MARKLTKIVCISDTHLLHNWHNDIPNGDIFIHAGDFSHLGHVSLEEFNDILGLLPHRYKLVVAGNHDYSLSKNSLRKNKKIFTNAIYLQDSSIVINKIKFYGSPWTCTEANMAFDISENEVLSKWNKIPKNTDVLITHTPPFGILDKAKHGFVGSLSLRYRVIEIKPKYHIFGHSHMNHGVVKTGSTTFINAAYCDNCYAKKFNAEIFEL